MKTTGRKGNCGMAEKGRQTARAPATKFAQMRKKMQKNRPVSKGGKKFGGKK